MSGLDDRQRKELSKLIGTARTTLFEDAETTLRGAYGILPDGTVQAESALAADPALRARRHTLEAVIAHLRADGVPAKAAVERLTREVAFTHLNRLLAIRVADALGVLPPSLRDGHESGGFRQWIGDLAPLLATADDTGGYWTYLSQCADELAIDAPALFDPRNPLLALRPSKPAFESLVALFADPNSADLWDADDTFGWAYQFFNTRGERQEMRKSSAPRDTRELAVRNQFFTPAYVVRFLVHNTLGRRLVDADPSTPLIEHLPLLIDPPTTRGAPLDLVHVKVLDPACGSGHFLLGCYAVLEAAWGLGGVLPAEAAARIVPALWGVDIDPRAVQVAQAAIVFRARRACGRSPLPPPNVVCARALPEDPEAWLHAQAGLGADLRHLVDAMRGALRDAPVLGPLLKAEQRLDSEIRTTVVAASDEGDDLFSTAGIAHDTFGTAERAVIAALQRAADATSATPAEQLLAARASDAVRFVETVRNRYDAVLMNPPFGEPVPSTKDYIKAAYPWIPTRDFNLLAAFVGRGVELCKPDGYLGAITSRAGMFLKTFERWRKEVMLANHLVTLADLGYGVMEEAMVEAAAYVLSPRPPSRDHASVYVRLLKESDRPAGLAAAVKADRHGLEDHHVLRVQSVDFAAIPGSPMAYWMSEPIRRLFTALPRLEGNGAEARQGLASGDDFRFVRLFWEVDARRIARARDETQVRRWVPFAKGGDYGPYWSDIHLVVNFERDGRLLKESAAVIRNPQFYFRPGLTWPERTASGFGPRVLPAGCAFSHVGHGAFAVRNASELLVLLNTRLFGSLLAAFLAAGEETSSGSPAKRYSVGSVQNSPWLGAAPVDTGSLANEAAELIGLIRSPDELDETTRAYSGPAAAKQEHTQVIGVARDQQAALFARVQRAIGCSHKVEQIVDAACELDEEAVAYVDDEWDRHPGSYGDEQLSPTEQRLAAQLWSLPTDQLIERVTATRGASKGVVLQNYVADRRVEILAHSFSRHPRAVAEALTAEDAIEFGAVESEAHDFLSWLVGLAFGRWDARGPRSSGAFDPFAPVPLCPPGMLVGDDGFPSYLAPPGYPLTLPPDIVLLDQPGHALDLSAAVEAAARAMLDNGDDLLADAVGVLGKRNLRDLFAKAFFKEHLSRYSKSRRQAPIYWQLTIPSGNWSAWLYAPRFSREMLYAVVTLADHRFAGAGERIRSLQGDTSGSDRQRAKAIDVERTLASELKDLRNDVAHLAGLGWQPDSDDGFVLCAAPLAKWFPRNTWRQLAEQLESIKRGDYPWATVHKFRDAL